MSIERVTRRNLMRWLPLGAVPFTVDAVASAQSAGCGLVISAVDSLHHYEVLLDRVTITTMKVIGKATADALLTCQAQAAELRVKLDDLRSYLRQNHRQDGLQERLATIDHSLAQMKGATPGGLNAEAVEKELPATLDALQLLMKTVESACRVDEDGRASQLIDAVYSALDGSNGSVAAAADARSKWADGGQKVSDYKDLCLANMVAASEAISAQPTQVREAVEQLTEAQDNLKLLLEQGKEETSAGEPAAGETLQLLLAAAKQTLLPTTGLKRTAFLLEQAPASGAGMSDQNPVLVQALWALVRNNKYYKQGCLTNVVNTLAVCWPIWVMYGNGNEKEIKTAKDLIASALLLELIWGTVPESHSQLSVALWNAYRSRTA